MQTFITAKSSIVTDIGYYKNMDQNQMDQDGSQFYSHPSAGCNEVQCRTEYGAAASVPRNSTLLDMAVTKTCMEIS